MYYESCQNSWISWISLPEQIGSCFPYPCPSPHCLLLKRENVFCVCRKGLSNHVLFLYFLSCAPWKAHKTTRQIPGTITHGLASWGVSGHFLSPWRLEDDVLAVFLRHAQFCQRAWKLGFVVLYFLLVCQCAKSFQERVNVKAKWTFTVVEFGNHVCLGWCIINACSLSPGLTSGRVDVCY